MILRTGDYFKRNPDCTSIPENSLSLGFRLDYGAFSAYFGGDVDYPDYEDRLAPVIGRVDVCKMNHHGCPTSMGRDYPLLLAIALVRGDAVATNSSKGFKSSRNECR